jgi:hypothetical protein
MSQPKWIPWRLAPDSDPEERWILVSAGDHGVEHPDDVIYATEETAREAALSAEAASESVSYEGALIFWIREVQAGDDDSDTELWGAPDEGNDNPKVRKVDLSDDDPGNFLPGEFEFRARL